MLLFNKKNNVLLWGVTALLISACQPLVALKPAPQPPVVVQTDADNGSVTTAEAVVAIETPETVAEHCSEPTDLWSRIRSGFQLSGITHKRIKSDLDWYTRHQPYLDRVAERARPYLHLIVEKVEQRDMPLELALLPVVESAYQPFAYSHGRAAGLWQFIPGTGRRFGLKQTWWYDGRRDVALATDAALDYLEYLHKLFDGDWLLALAAYNSGEGTVRKAIRHNKRRGKGTDYWSLDLPPETEGYVPKLLAVSMLVDNPVAHGVTLESIADEAFLTTVDVGSQIDLDLAAELAEVTVEEMYRYNPGFNRWATDPRGPHQLLVPIDKAQLFQANLTSYPDNKRISWTRHRIRSGESLGIIAERYKTTIPLIKKVNRLRGTMIRAGQELVIPVARKELSRYRLSSNNRLSRVQNTKRSGKRIDYHVKEGDTLWEIAQEYKVSVRSLAKWNGMAPRDTLKPGSKLVIWTKETSRISSVNPASFTHPFQDTTRRRIGYRVRSGDSLARISQRFRVSIDNLKRWNDLEGKKYLQPGQRLTLYVDVTRQTGNI